SGPPCGSYVYQILPFIDQMPLYTTANGTVAGPQNAIAAFSCPGRGRPGYVTDNTAGPTTDFGINPWLRDTSGGTLAGGASTNKLTMVGITDGTSNTILVMHQSILTTQYSGTTGGGTDQHKSFWDNAPKATSRNTGTFHRDYSAGYNAIATGDW